LAWSVSIASERILPLASIHPADPDPAGKAARIAAAGLKGVKLHAYYQDFDVDEERLWPLYAALAREGLVLVMHAGFDPAYPFIDRAGPLRNLRVQERFPNLKLVVGHFGSWKQWDEVARWLIGKPIYLETSFALDLLPPDVARDMMCAHPRDYLLFGSDSPWRSVPAALALLRALRLDPALERAILGCNARRLLGLK
jgi:predicted TIM-barrel fold metal-dependent hydrolase